MSSPHAGRHVDALAGRRLDDALELGLSEQQLRGGRRIIVEVLEQHRRRAGLRVHIDDQHARSADREAGSEMGRDGGLAHPALSVRDSDRVHAKFRFA